MSPAKVTTPNGKVFYVPDGQTMSRQEGFRDLSTKEQIENSWSPVIGTQGGYEIVDITAKSRGSIFVEKNCEPQYTPQIGWAIKISPDGKYTMVEGTTVEPVTTDEMNETPKGKER